jgi:tRNA dimethylallyltransferase
MNKLLIIVGPTSSGKSELAVKLAKRYNGEIISADSRQIYRGMDLGTGKVQGKWKESFFLGREKSSPSSPAYIYKNVPHYCIDFVNPKKQYSAALFQRDAKKTIADILARGKLPILCGGTAHWIDAVAYNQRLPDVKPDPKLRRRLEKLSTECLFARISTRDPQRAKTIDKHNRRRLIRALEIIITTGKPVPQNGVILSASEGSLKNRVVGDSSPSDALGLRMTPYKMLWLGINPPQSVLFSKIKTRLNQRLKAGMIKEVRQLHSPLPMGEGRVRVRKPKTGLSWHRLESFGLEYKFVSLYLQKKITYDEMFDQLFTAIKQYTKRQMTWWKRNKKIRWIASPNQVIKPVEKFLK